MKVSIIALLGLFIQSSFGQNLLSDYPSLIQSIQIFTICLFAILFFDGIYFHLDAKKKLKAHNLAEQELETLKSEKSRAEEDKQQLASAAKAEKQELEQSIKELQAQLQQASNNQESTSKELNNINQLLSESKASVAKLTQDNQSLSQQVDSLQVAFQDSQSKQQTLEQKLGEKTKETNGQEAITLLSLLQQQGRFMDFVMNDITNYPDQQVGAVARVIHQGCSKVMKEFFTITPIETTEEGSLVSVATEDQLASFKILGDFDEQFPVEGRLTHKGWQTEEIKLPKLAKNQGNIIAPAEIQVN